MRAIPSQTWRRRHIRRCGLACVSCKGRQMRQYGFKGTNKTRRGRSSEPNRVYHVTAVTLNRAPLFQVFEFGQILATTMRHQVTQQHARSLAFVIMPDHVHWLLQLTGSRSLSMIVNVTKSGTARRINSVRDTNGQIWQKGFYDRAIRREEDLESVARYIVTNPLRAGLTDSLRRYPLWDAIWV